MGAKTSDQNFNVNIVGFRETVRKHFYEQISKISNSTNIIDNEYDEYKEANQKIIQLEKSIQVLKGSVKRRLYIKW